MPSRRIGRGGAFLQSCSVFYEPNPDNSIDPSETLCNRLKYKLGAVFLHSCFSLNAVNLISSSSIHKICYGSDDVAFLEPIIFPAQFGVGLDEEYRIYYGGSQFTHRYYPTF